MHAFRLIHNLSTRVSCKYSLNPNFQPQFCTRSTNYLNRWTNSDSKPKNDTKVAPRYDPISGNLVTHRRSNVYDNHERKQKVPNFSGDGDDNFRNSRSGSRKWKRFRAVSGDGQWRGSRFLEGDGGEKKVASGPVRLMDVNRGGDQKEWRIPLSGLFGKEVARVLGGGLVPGSLVFVGGDLGVGKSTLLLQIAAIISEGREMRHSAPVVYISGEESIEQIGNRADRMRICTEELFLYSGTDVEDILEKTQPLSPRALIVDSIQTVYLKGVNGSPGDLSQVKECTSALLRFARKTNIPVFLIGHVCKSGDIAGPRFLEHIVDVVLYLESVKHSSHRLLRSVKNRFGFTDELGVFEMSQSGLQAVPNPSDICFSQQQIDSEVLAGLAVTVIMDGSRSFLIEIQALCVASSTKFRQVTGLCTSRDDMIISVLMKQAGLRLQQNGIFLNVVGGLTVSETASDLAVAAAICSSFLEFPIPPGVVFIAEVGLGGELHTVPRMENRVITVAKLGYKMCVVPSSAVKSLSNLSTIDLREMEILGCGDLKEVINHVFR